MTKKTVFRLMLWLFSIWVVTGCGRKAPPVAPGQKPLAAVMDLKSKMDKEVVQLLWHHDPVNWRAEEYVVLEAREALNQKRCSDCPLTYLKVGEVRISEPLSHKKHQLVFSKKLVVGYRYTFQVRPLSAADAQGPDSNLVVIEVKE